MIVEQLGGHRGKTDQIHGNEFIRRPSKQGGDCDCGLKSLNRFEPFQSVKMGENA